MLKDPRYLGRDVWAGVWYGFGFPPVWKDWSPLMSTPTAFSGCHSLCLGCKLLCFILVCLLGGCFQVAPPAVPQAQSVLPPDVPNSSRNTEAFNAALPAASSDTETKSNRNQDTPLAQSGIRNVSATISENSAWPNWMGPDHNGISHQTGWSTEWPQGGLPIVWSQQIGIGFSSMAIAEGRLFTLGHIDGKESIYCLKTDSGETVWSFSYASPLVDNLHDGGPGATPTLDGNFVYTLGRGGQLYCLRAATGKVVWSRMLQKDLDVELPEWGFTSSPLILDNQVILEAGRVVSYDKLTGRKNWQTDRHAAGYGSAARLESAGVVLLATLDCDGLRVLRSSDGKQLDFQPWESPFLTNSTTPIVERDMIYISSGYNVGCGLFRFSGDTLELLYSNREMRNHFNNSILLDGHLYGFDGNSNLGRVVQLTCMDFKTGEVLWKKRGLGCGSLMVANGKLVLLSDQGDLVVANATPKSYQELCRSRFLSGRCWTMPVLLNGFVYGRSASGQLTCLRLPLDP